MVKNKGSHSRYFLLCCFSSMLLNFDSLSWTNIQKFMGNKRVDTERVPRHCNTIDVAIYFLDSVVYQMLCKMCVLRIFPY